MATIDSENTEVAVTQSESAPWYRRVLWLIAIWFGSVIALGIVASGFRFMMQMAGVCGTPVTIPGGGGLPGGQTGEIHAREESARAERAIHEDDDPHLRSCKAIIGYHIKATDGDVGHVESLLINEETWAIQYLVVNTSNWWLGHKVLIAPEWIDEVRWLDKTVSVDLECDSVKTSPPFESSEQLNREREVNLYNHYGRSGYWLIETVIEQEK